MAKLSLIDVPVGDYGAHEDEMVRYRAEGVERADALGNRGPIRYDADGNVEADIIDAYNEHGFYIFEGVLSPTELSEIEADLAEMMERLPVAKDAPVDAHGRPALGVGLEGRNVVWVEPLSDPVGGTDANHGRHQAKMIEPTPHESAPDHVVQVILGSLQFSQAVLRVYGHPDLLRVAEAIHGPDFTPFNEALFIKQPGLGGSVAWHQDPWTHWDSPDLDANTHGFNFMGQLYGSTPANGLWVVPGSHRRGRADIAGMVAAAGSDRLPDAVPVVCAPGDVGICNRQAIHGSFANTSPDPRLTINMGFHRRSSVLGVESGGVHNPVSVYTPERIDTRSQAIAYAIDARAQHYPHEERYVYEPFVGREDDFRFGPDTLEALRDYNLLDLGI